MIMNLQYFILGIKILDYFILATKKWPNNVHVGCDGAMKPKNMLNFMMWDHFDWRALKTHWGKRYVEKDNYEFD